MNIQIPTCFLTKWQQTLVLMSEIFSVPVALITSGEEHNFQILLSNNNIQHPYNKRELPQEACLAYSQEVSSKKSILNIPNALNDPEWRESLESKNNLINYIGTPLYYPNGKVAGTLCIMDTMERHYVKNQIDIFQKFAETINIDLEIITNNLKTKNELQEKLDYESALRKDNYFAKVMLKLNANLHNVYSKNVVQRYNEQIDEVVDLVSGLPYKQTILDLPKLFRYLIPDECRQSIKVRLDQINVKPAISVSKSVEVIIRIIMIYILLEEINASIFASIIGNELHISFLLTLDKNGVDDYERNIKEPILILSEQYKGNVFFGNEDDLIYKTEIILPIEII